MKLGFLVRNRLWDIIVCAILRVRKAFIQELIFRYSNGADEHGPVEDGYGVYDIPSTKQTIRPGDHSDWRTSGNRICYIIDDPGAQLPWESLQGREKMSVKSQFCRTLSRVQEKEMQEFIDAVDKRNFNKASNLLESLGAMQELGMDICEIPRPRRE